MRNICTFASNLGDFRTNVGKKIGRLASRLGAGRAASVMHDFKTEYNGQYDRGLSKNCTDWVHLTELEKETNASLIYLCM